MAHMAVVLHGGSPGRRERNLQGILEFFGISTTSLAVDGALLPPIEGIAGTRYAMFVSLELLPTIADTPQFLSARRGAAALYLYATEHPTRCERGLQRLDGWQNVSLATAVDSNVCLKLSDQADEVCGPMSGLTTLAALQPEDFILLNRTEIEKNGGRVLLSADDAAMFVRFRYDGVPAFLCSSGATPDIDQPLAGAFFDVKRHFCSIVPLIAFIRWAFQDTMWRPQENGACLIIDDPLLRKSYGFVDFPHLLRLMERHGFTTNIAFIPWNWRRTSPKARTLFADRHRLSVSIHGCDHIAAEFGETSVERLSSKASLAQARMAKHRARTGIPHDAIMVFPQGVYSSPSPRVLKHSGFLAAVNTEVNPVDADGAATRVSDVWDTAIMRYGTFPIFTRRYAAHGLENFAFDLLIGKPCLIVAHHDAFRDGGAALVDFIDQLNGLSGTLVWRSLGEVIRRACRRRSLQSGLEEVRMYGRELTITNPSSGPITATVRLYEPEWASVAEICAAGRRLEWTTAGDEVTFAAEVPPESSTACVVRYTHDHAPPAHDRPFRYKMHVAARRLLSEFRDEYVQRLFYRRA